MKSDLTGISIYYASYKWPGLISYVKSVFHETNTNSRPFVFFNNVKGDSLRLVVSASMIPVSDTIILFTNYIQEHPSRRSKNNLKMGETLWMNYPNNQVLVNNFKIDICLLSGEETARSSIMYLFSKAVSSFLLKSGISGSNILGYFLQLIILVSKCLEIKDVFPLLTCLIESVENDSEIKQKEDEWKKILNYALSDSNANAAMIHQLIIGNIYSSAYSRPIVELSEEISDIVIISSKKMYYDPFIRQIIFHLGIDYRKQLYVLYMLRYYYLTLV